MNQDLHLHNLRVKFIELNMEYNRRITEGEPMGSLVELKAEINYLTTQIDELEKESKGKKPK